MKMTRTGRTLNCALLVGQAFLTSGTSCRPERLKNLEPADWDDPSGAFVPLQLEPVDDEFDASGKLVGRKMSKEEYYRLCREQDAEGDEDVEDESSSPEPAAAVKSNKTQSKQAQPKKAQPKKSQPKKEAAKQSSSSNSRAQQQASSRFVS